MSSKRSDLFRLWPYIKQYRVAITMVILLAIPMAAIKTSIAKVIQFFTDSVLVEKDSEMVKLVAISIILLGIANFVIRFFHFYIIRATATRIVQQLRNEIYQHITRLSVSYFNEKRGGAILSRVMNDIQLISQGISSINQLFREPLVFVFLLAYLFYLNWKLTLCIIVIGPLLAFLLSNVGRHSKRYSTKIQESFADLSAVLSETFTGVRVIKGFNLESFMKGQFMLRNRNLSRTALKAIRVEELSRPGIEFIASISAALIVLFGGLAVSQSEMASGELMGFLAALALLMNSLRSFGDLTIRYNQTSAAAKRVFELLDEKLDIVDVANATEMPRFQQEIEFRNLNFSYDSNKQFLQNFSLKIKKGEKVALVGASGAGKSTILSLLMRFYDPNTGAIFIDGKDIRDFKIKSLREQMAIVTQEVFLFHDSIRSNIRAGHFESNDQELIDAAKAAQAWSFVEQMPEKLDTVIGDRGQKLSGGERQRISIARAILRDPPILLLDEATSALDTKNEQLVQAALDNLLKGKTAIIIAHRLSTIKKVDRIIVIEDGRIVEEGSHQDLIAYNGAYARSLSLQN